MRSTPRADGLIAAVDGAENAQRLAYAAREFGRPIRLIVDYEIGGGRTGVADEAEAVRLAAIIAEMDGADFAGVQGYMGAHQTVASLDERRAITLRHGARLVHLVERLSSSGLVPEIVCGGGTGTHAIETELGIGVEVQAGSYVFMDVKYSRVVMRPSDPHPFIPSLFVQTTVISAAQAGSSSRTPG